MYVKLFGTSCCEMLVNKKEFKKTLEQIINNNDRSLIILEVFGDRTDIIQLYRILNGKLINISSDEILKEVKIPDFLNYYLHLKQKGYCDISKSKFLLNRIMNRSPSIITPNGEKILIYEAKPLSLRDIVSTLWNCHSDTYDDEINYRLFLYDKNNKLFACVEKRENLELAYIICSNDNRVGKIVSSSRIDRLEYITDSSVILKGTYRDVCSKYSIGYPEGRYREKTPISYISAIVQEEIKDMGLDITQIAILDK